MFKFGWILIKLFSSRFDEGDVLDGWCHTFTSIKFSAESIIPLFSGNVVINILAGGRTIKSHRQIYGTLRATMGIPAGAASESLLIEQSDLRKLQNGGDVSSIGRPDEENYAAEVSSIAQIINYGLKTTAPDEFGTIVVDTSSLPSDPATFSNLLEISLKQWRKQVKLSKLYLEEVRRRS